MSLAVLADHMASKGRGPDSMLIHMSPTEVQGLQALAMKHGGSLTINPHTGLPEAGFLDKLLPAIIGFAITATTGIPAWQVGLGVGAVETARTGDLGKGISAGLGAYGGAGMGMGLSEAGASTLNNAAGQSYLSTAPGALADAGAGLTGDMAYNLENAGASTSGAMSTAQQAAIDKAATATPFDKLSAGFDAAKTNPSSLLTKDNAKYLMAAAAPVLADQAVKANLPTTTTRPGEVHRFSYNPYNQYYTPAGNYEVPVKSAASGGIMGFDESSNSPMSHQSLNNMQDSGGMFNYAHDGGGIMKMAKGGLGSIAHFAAGGDAALEAYQAGNYAEANRLLGEAGMSAQDVVSKYGLSQADAATVAKNLGYAGDMSGLQYAAPPAVQAAAPIVQAAAAPVVQAAEAPVAQAQTQTAAAPAYTQYTNEQIGSYLAANPTADIAAATKATNADPAAVNAYIASLTSPFVGSTLDTRGSGTLGIYNQLTAQGVDPDEYYKAALANDPKYAGWSLADIKRGYKLDEGAYALSKKLSGNVSDKDWVKFMDEGGYSVNDMAQAFGLSTREVQARYDAAKTKTTPITCPAGYRLNAAGTACELIPITKDLPPPTSVDHSGYHLENGVWVPNVDATQHTTTNVTTPTDLFTAPSTSLPVGIAGNTGPSQIGGGATINPNGTITTSPRIPGIPVGGFTGMEQVRDAYTTGGGKLGYVPYAPKTMDEFNTKYNKLTGGSKAAYDYLTGKTPYSPKPVTETGEIMKPYSESVLGMPMSSSSKQYLFDPATKKYALNPDYIPVSYTSEGKKVYGLSSKDIAAQLPGVATSDYEKWMQDNNVTLAQIAQSLGISLAEAKKRYPTAGSTTDKTTSNASSGVDLSQNPAANGGLMGTGGLAALTMARGGTTHMPFFSKSTGKFTSRGPQVYGDGGMAAGGQFDLGSYSDGGRLLRGPGDGVSDSIPATIGNKRPARLADGEFVVPARIVSELGNGSTEAGARKLYAMMDRVQAARKGSIGKGKVANNSRADKYLPV